MATVLIAESDLQMQQELRSKLEAMGLDVVEAADWPDTLRKAAVHRPDLILVSEDLPQLSTLQVCLQLRGIGGMFKTPLVLILPEHADELSPEAMRRARVSETIARDRMRTHLLALLRNHLPLSGSGVSSSENFELVRGLPVAPDGTVGTASGDLAQMSAPTLLGQLACRWSTGTLSLERDGLETRIHLQRGNIVDASSSVPSLALEPLLAQNRLVSEADLARARAHVAARGGSLEQALLELRLLDEQRLRRVQLYQRQHAVLLPFSWRRGSFAFEPAPLEPERLELGFGSIDILFGGLRALRDAHRIESSLPPATTVLKRTQHAFDGFQLSKLTDVERNVFFLVDEGASIGSLLSRPRTDHSETVRALCALFAAGVVETVASGSPAEPTEPVAPPPAVEPAAVEPPAPQAAAAASAAEPDEEPVAIEEGSLSVLPVAKLLSELYSDRRTGVLFFTQGEQVKQIFLDHGRIVLARSNQAEDTWSAVLLRRGLLTPGEARLLERQPSEDRNASTPPLRPDALAWTLQPSWLRAEQIVLSLFDWTAGMYRFEEGPLPLHDGTIVPGRTEGLLIEGIRRLGNRAWSTTSLPPATHYVAARAEAFALELGPFESKLLAALDGRITIAETPRLNEELNADVQPLLHGFLLLGLVRTASKPIPLDLGDVRERRGDALMRQIDEFASVADSENYFAILGAPPDADADFVKTRYKLLREKYHPDRARELGMPDAIDLLSDYFGKIYLAYQSLIKPEVRKAHLDELDRQAQASLAAQDASTVES